MKRVLLGLGVLLVIAVVVVYMLRLPLSLHFANAYLHDKNISIGAISGDFIHDLAIEKIVYNDQRVASRIACEWNVWQMLDKKVAIEACRIQDIDINQTIALSKLFSSTKTTQSDDNNSLSWSVEVGSLELNAFYDRYDINLSGKLQNDIFDVESIINTPYVKNIAIKSSVDIKSLQYKGKVSVANKDLNIQEYGDMLQDLALNFKGNTKGIEVEIDSHYLKGSFVTHDFNHSIVTLYTKEKMALKGFVPQELKTLELNFVLTSSLYLDGITPVHAYFDVQSNLANLKLDSTYSEDLGFKGELNFPKDSLLHNYDKNLHLDKLGQIFIDAKMEDNQSFNVALDAKRIGAKLLYHHGNLDAHFNVASQNIALKGELDKKVVADINIPSIRQLLHTIKPIYSLDLPRLRGELFANATVTKQKNIDLKLRSSKISIDKNKISDIKLEAASNLKSVTIKNYQLSVEKMRLFATKDSHIKLKEDRVLVDKFWINDQAWVAGEYHTKQAKGELNIISKGLQLTHPEYIDTRLNGDIKIVLDKALTNIKGELQIDGGTILYKIEQNENYALDKDIIIQKKAQKKAPDNLSIDLAITSTKPLFYKTKDANIQANLDLKLSKNVGKALQLNGAIRFLDWSSYYRLQNKTIRLKKSLVSFNGDPTQPILDIKAYYQNSDVNIVIYIAGTPTAPILRFTSNPSMKREAILSILLLDSSAGGNVNQKEDLQYLLGSAMAKSFLANMGLRVEHFVVTDSKIEIGKKIGDKITIIYLGDEVSSVKVVYDYSRKVEADFIINKESSSMDIFYKGEF
ncbi:MAG: translocation/assembly module TamB domain-containing protein [Campylobacterales bacterium]|nr:translocation/assembly module TamB domain-containing protein [Campylobacterales bacterium]